jgi:putative ABC transport system permease protein
MRKLVRSLARSRSYAVTVVLTMALGLAAMGALFAVAKAVLLAPLPYPRPDRLFALYANRIETAATQSSSAPQTPFLLSPIELARLRERAVTLEQVEGISPTEMALTTTGDPETLRVGAVSAGFLRLFGLQPELGRDFSEDEDSQRLSVAILDGGFWARRFASNPQVVGQTIRLDGTAFLVVGVSPAGYRPLLQSVDVWIPLGVREQPTLQNLRSITGAARLRVDRTIADARAEVLDIQRQIRRDYPESHANFTVALDDLRDSLYGGYRTTLFVLTAAVVSLLLIACTNVGTLTLCRVIDRQGEFALRASLGASRFSIVREQLGETAVLCAAGGGAGLAAAWWLIPLILAVYPDAVPADADVAIDLGVTASMIGVMIGAALIAGLVPALRAGKAQAVGVLTESWIRTVGSRREGRIRDVILAGQVAVCLVLLALGAIVATSTLRLCRIHPGFDADGVLTLQLAPPARYPDAQSRADFLKRVLERIHEIPEVVAAGSTQTTFDSNGGVMTRVDIEGQATDPGRPVQVHIRHVTPGYFTALRVRVVDGDAFSVRDRIGAPMVAVVSQSFARRYWPGQSALGRRVRRVLATGYGPWLTVLGVTEDVMDNGLGADLGPMLYVPYLQQNTPTARIGLTIRTKTDAMKIADGVRRAIWSVDPVQPIDQVRTLESALSTSVAQPRFQTLLVGLFGMAGLALACVGVYGVAAYTTRQRTREVGVRMALGADARTVIAWILRRTMPPVLIGAMAGLAGTILLVRSMISILYQPNAADAGSVVLSALLLLACATGATLVPATRAASLTPTQALTR